VLDLILAGGFEKPDVSEPLIIDGRRIVPDFRWAEQHLIVEADGAQWHDHKLAREDDAERQAFLEAHGEQVIRVTWTQTVTQQAQTLARLSRSGAPQRRRVAG
jgi:very-short-patch-repair endonuclease